MRSIIKYCLICVFLCRSLSAFTADIHKGNCADSLLAAGNYKLAALEYERAFYATQDDALQCEALLKKSYCYKSAGDFDKGAQTLQRINLSFISDSMQYKVRHEHALDCYLAGKFEDADELLMQINYYTKNKDLADNSLYLDILNKNELQEWKASDSLFMIYLKVNNISIDSNTINQLLKKPRLLNEKTAEIISFIVPCSGQIYSGHVLRGLSSIILQGGVGWFTYDCIKDGFYLSGVFMGFTVFQMLYFGGANYAYYLAEKKNVDKITMYNKKIRDFILKQESVVSKQ
jgi:tetratricopeptide (TPR) repeat protein